MPPLYFCHLMSLICAVIDVLTPVLNIKLAYSSHPIVMYVCLIN